MITPPVAAPSAADAAPALSVSALSSRPSRPGPYLRARTVCATPGSPSRDGEPRPLVSALRAPLTVEPVPPRLPPEIATACRPCGRRPRAGHLNSESEHAPTAGSTEPWSKSRPRRLEQTNTRATAVASCPGSLRPFSFAVDMG